MPPDNSWYDYDEPIKKSSKRFSFDGYAQDISQASAELSDSSFDNSIIGIVAMYPSVKHIPSDEIQDYLKKLSKDNSAKVDIFLESGFSVVWLPTRRPYAFHMETWQLAHAENKSFVLSVDCSDIEPTKRNSFANYIGSKFQEEQSELFRELSSKGFNFKFKPTTTSHTRILLF